jgi:hypothetical protein
MHIENVGGLFSTKYCSLSSRATNKRIQFYFLEAHIRRILAVLVLFIFSLVKLQVAELSMSLNLFYYVYYKLK